MKRQNYVMFQSATHSASMLDPPSCFVIFFFASLFLYRKKNSNELQNLAALRLQVYLLLKSWQRLMLFYKLISEKQQ